MKKKSLLLILICWHLNIFCMHTLSTLQTYAHQYDEFPKADNNNWLDADFSTYHTSIRLTWLDRFLSWIGLKLNEKWDPQNFANLLQQVTKKRTDQFGSGRLINTLVCPNNSKLFIFGDLHGAFHSLIRDLSWMKEQNIIDNNLNIIEPNHYLIFNGDAIDRSPYTLETMHTILILLKQNPDNAIYIRGNHEDEGSWIDYGLKRELKIRASHVSQENVPLEKEVNLFFNTLPLALFIATPQDLHNVIQISHRDRNNDELIRAEETLDAFFTKHAINKNLISHTISKNNSKKTSTTQIVAVVETQPWRHEIKGMNGLNNLEQDKGAAAWTVLSSPIQAHQDFLEFYFDAFAQIVIHEPISQSTISIFNRDIRKPNDLIKKIATYNIVSGMKSTNGTLEKSPDKPFTIGSSMSLKKGVPILGQRVKRGMATRINEENKNGGVKGKHIRSVVYNDNYVPHLARPNIDRLISHDQTDIILLPVGTPTLTAYAEYTKNGKALVLFPVTGASDFRDLQFQSMIHFRGTYADEVKALIDYMVDVRAAHKFAFFYQDDSFGNAPLAAARKALKAKGIDKWTELPYLRGSTDFKVQAQKINQVQPDAIGLFSTAQATREFMRLLGVDFLANKQLFGISFLGEESFRRYVSKQGLNVLLGAVVPNPTTSDLQIAKDYRKLMDHYKYPYDVFSFEAYIATSIFLDALHKIEPPFTKEKILKQLESLNKYNFKGLPLTFNPKTRSITPYIWIESNKNEEWVRKEIKHSDTPINVSRPQPKKAKIKTAQELIEKRNNSDDPTIQDTAKKLDPNIDQEKKVEHMQKPEQAEKKDREDAQKKQSTSKETQELISNL